MKLYRNDELFNYDGTYLDFSVGDCLNYTFGDLSNNTTRGAIAEYIVAKALEIDTSEHRKDWLDYDLIYKDKQDKDIRIEVKASGYIQSWNEHEDFISNIVFSIKPSKDYDKEHHIFLDHKTRKSDIYIFCLLAEKSKEKLSATDLSQWQFYVVPTKSIDEKCGNQQIISLNRLKTLFDVREVDYYNLKSEVDKLL
jgi:hypothetical protein